MRYFVSMNYVDMTPSVLYQFDPKKLDEQLWRDGVPPQIPLEQGEQAGWIDAKNQIIESLFKTGELDEVSREYAENFFPQAFALG